MSISLLVGTAKGLLISRSNSDRTQWRTEPLALKGWITTSAVRASPRVP